MGMYGRFPKRNGREVFARPVVDCSKDEPLTVQSDAAAADINKIIARMEKSGMVTASTRSPYFGDVSEFGDLQDSLIKVQEANRRFMELPANIRERFANDPVKLVSFLEDEANRPEAEELGLVNKAVETPSPAAPAIPPAPPAAGTPPAAPTQ